MKYFLISILLLLFSLGHSQSDSNELDAFKPNPEKESKYLPFLALRHGGMENIEAWKKENTVLYYKELWYFAESFYIKRNHYQEGVYLNEAHIDITRFEAQRKSNEEVFVSIPGCKDVIVLLPENKLIYKAQF
jgi:hypothetical protein